MLKALSHPDDPSLENLAQAKHLSQPALTAALTRLDRHDVVTVDSDRAHIHVELFRRWLLRQSDQQSP